MKKILFVGTILLGLSFSSYGADSSSGCGMGWKIAPKNSLISSTTRAYVNATFSNTLGMTSGTSGCAKHSIVKNEFRGIHYIDSNYHQFVAEMAKGEGSVIDGFADVVDYKGDKEFFRALVQINFSKIYPSKDTSPQEVFRNFKKVVVENQQFSFI